MRSQDGYIRRTDPDKSVSLEISSRYNPVFNSWSPAGANGMSRQKQENFQLDTSRFWCKAFWTTGTSLLPFPLVNQPCRSCSCFDSFDSGECGAVAATYISRGWSWFSRLRWGVCTEWKELGLSMPETSTFHPGSPGSYPPPEGEDLGGEPDSWVLSWKMGRMGTLHRCKWIKSCCWGRVGRHDAWVAVIAF